jgi:signal recognition particle receptor subunit beta
MASFDSTRNCHVVRVVYDGPGFAGKTTNLQHVCKVIPATRRSEMYTPAQLKGRTMFFDWLELDGPAQGGVALKFHLITVPGQIERNYRRRPLVEMADVLVFVCDASPKQIPDTLRTFARLRASMKRRSSPVPLVLQANKQDIEGSLQPHQLRKKLNVETGVPMITASASTGRGVKETLTTAIRLGVETLRNTEAQPLIDAFANADNLFDHVLGFEDNPNNDEPVDAEELNVNAEHVDMSESEMAAHLGAATSLDALEARARKAVKRGKTASSGE